jgi:hypothetical protein
MVITFDFEFTGLHKNTTAISLGLVTETGKKFYAEFNDYDKTQCDDWINENVISKLKYNEYIHFFDNNEEDGTFIIKHDKSTISDALKTWLAEFKNIEFWGDCVTFDWILFVDLYFMGDISRKPPNNFTSYQAYDLHTILHTTNRSKVNRHTLLGIDDDIQQHNSLYDADITMRLYEKYVLKKNN